MGFIHLHTHSHYSLLDGLGKIPDLVKRAKEYGMDSLALTDHGVMYGSIEFYEQCHKQGIKPVIGVEAYIATRGMNDRVPKIDTKPYHLVLLAENNEGYENLLKIVTIAHLEGYYYKPRIDKENLRKHSKGLIALSACLGGEVANHASHGNLAAAEKAALEYVDIFGKDNFFLELQHHPNLERQEIANEALIELAKKHNIGLVATNDIHYIDKEDAEAQDVLLCVQTGKFLTDTDRMSMKEGGDWLDISFKSPEEMAENFANVPEAIENTQKIADRCNVEIELGKFRFPEFQLPEGENYESYLRQLINQRLPKAVPEITKTMKDRIEYEMKVIRDKGYLGYFLIVQDFVHWAKSNGIPTNTRGSAAGCFVSFALGITSPKLNPLDYNLPFERFLNPFRPSAPDIDIDIADAGRDPLIQYVSEKYGADRVAQICTFGTMAAKNAIRDVARVLGFPYAFGDSLSKMIPVGSQTIHITLQKAIETIPEMKLAYETDPNAKRVLDLAKRLEGCARHSSVHAAGVVIAPDEITKFTPIMRDNKGGRLVTQYEMHAVGEDGVGLIKMDFLGLANLTIIQDVLKIIKKTKNETVVLDEIPLDDKKAFELLANAETIGVFQLESEGMRKYIKELRPTTINDIMAMVALYRPGPMNFIPQYIERKRDPKKIVYLDPRMSKFLDKSYGLIVYQDDVLMIAIELAGYNWQEVDKFRKAIGKKIVSEMAAQKEKFFKQIIERGMKEDIATELWNQIETFAGYGFNKAHAASYGLVAYQTAYLKANYPSEFMAAWLTSEQQRDIEKVAFALQEAERMKIKVLPPNVNSSFVDFGVIPETGDISYALASIKNVGRGAAEEIVAARKEKGEFKTLEDFIDRLGPTVLNKKILENLAKAGALDSLCDRNTILENMEDILKFCTNLAKDKQSTQINLFGLQEQSALPSLKLRSVKPAEKKQSLAWEKELLGIYLSDHPLKTIQTILPKIATPINELYGKVGSIQRLGGIITNAKRIITKNNEPMVFMLLEDLTGNIEAVVFPRAYEKIGEKCIVDSLVCVEGKIQNKDGEFKILADEIEEISSDPEEIIRLEIRYQKNQSEKIQAKTQPKAPSKWQGGQGQRSAGQTSVPAKISTPAPAAPLKPTVPPLILRLERTTTKATLEKIQQIIAEYKGNTPLVLELPENSHYKQVKTRSKINLDPELISKIGELIPHENIFAPS